MANPYGLIYGAGRASLAIWRTVSVRLTTPAAHISVSTLRRCERGEPVSDYARKQIIAALEAQGATFIGGKAVEQLGGTRRAG